MIWNAHILHVTCQAVKLILNFFCTVLLQDFVAKNFAIKSIKSRFRERNFIRLNTARRGDLHLHHASWRRRRRRFNDRRNEIAGFNGDPFNRQRLPVHRNWDASVGGEIRAANIENHFARTFHFQPNRSDFRTQQFSGADFIR